MLQHSICLGNVVLSSIEGGFKLTHSITRLILHMSDVVDAATRSRMMAGIRSKNTTPELVVRKALHAHGFRFRLHSKGLPGKPDVVLPKWHVVLFVHGCFWHNHGCHLSKVPQGNATFWRAKLAANVERDRLIKNQLATAGWRVLTVWECAIRGKKALSDLPARIDALAAWIRDPEGSQTLEIAALGDIGRQYSPSGSSRKNDIQNN